MAVVVLVGNAEDVGDMTTVGMAVGVELAWGACGVPTTAAAASTEKDVGG